MNRQILKTSITLDMKKSRIRIHKSLYYALGQPKYVQLLVNPKDRKIGIKSVEFSSAFAQPIKVSTQKTVDKSYELYSSTLLNKLYDELQLLDENSYYRIEGIVSVDEKVALFSFDTIERITV